MFRIENGKFCTKKQNLLEALLFCYNLQKRAADSHRLLVETYLGHASDDSICTRWIREFKRGACDAEDAGLPSALKVEIII